MIFVSSWGLGRRSSVSSRGTSVKGGAKVSTTTSVGGEGALVVGVE